MACALLVYYLVAFTISSSDATVNNEGTLGTDGLASSMGSTSETLLPQDELRRDMEKVPLLAAGNMAIITTDGEHCRVGPG